MKKNNNVGISIVGLVCIFVCLIFLPLNIYSVYADSTLYNDFVVESDSASNYTINLFDFWIHESSISSDYTDPKNVVDSGINNGHLLIFSKASSKNGSWNMWQKKTSLIPTTNLVSSMLDGTGSPYLTLSDSLINSVSTLKGRNNESLAYLFDSNYTSDYKNIYTGVSGLLQNNESLGDYYDSTENYAYYDEQSNNFKLYSIGGVERQNEDNVYGQFFPFNSPEEVFNIVDGELQNKSGSSKVKSSSKILNHYFGLTIESEFMQPQNGIILSENGDSRDMVFTISGDDDIWLYIDGYLSVDIGGIHDAIKSEINFATGKVKVYPLYSTSDIVTEYYLGELFESNSSVSSDYMEENFVKEIDSEGNIVRYTFKDYTKHTLKMFYLERGNFDSNLIMSFFPSINGYIEEEKEPEIELEEPEEDIPVENPEDDESELIENPKTYDGIIYFIFVALVVSIVIMIVSYKRKKYLS